MRWLRRVARRTQAEADLDAEIRFHLEEEVRLRIERGEAPAQARADARRLFGNIAAVQETTREVWTWASLASAWRSVASMLRSFTRAKGFATAAVLTVALGIGANTVVFSLFDRVLFRPLPYSEPHRLVQVSSHWSPSSGEPVMPIAVTLGLARETDLFSGIGWATGGDPVPLVPVAGENPLFWLTGVTTGSLEVLGIRPVIGPGFSAMRATDLERPVLLTYETWQRQYGGSDDVLSLAWTARDAQQRDVHWRVVGVLPDGFLLPSPRLITAPYDGIYGVDPGLDRQIMRTDAITVAPFARLAPGVSLAAAQAGVDAFVASRFPRTRNPASLTLQKTSVSVVSLQSGLSTLARSYSWLAVVGAWAVLGATCLTLAMLLLTWSQSRRQDAGVRLALGASPRRLVVSALAESVVICAAGAVIGWLAYAWARPLFVSVLPQGLQSFAAETVDLRVIALTGGLALVSAIVAGVLPAIRTSRMAPLDVLRPSRDTFGRVDGAPMLLGAQAALGVMLLVGALAILPGVLRTLLAPTGFDARDLFMVSVPTANDETAEDAREQTRRGLAALDVARQLPGVVGAALSRKDPFWSSVVERQFPNRSGFAGRVLPVDADFFSTLAVPLKAGRTFSHTEVDQQVLVAIVNDAGARALWPNQSGQSAIGRTVTTLDGARVIVGVAADFRVGIDTPAEPTLFLPLSASEAYQPAGGAFAWNEYRVVLRMAPGGVPDLVVLSGRLREQSWMIPNWVGRERPESVAAGLDVALEKPRLLALIFGTLAGITLVLTTIAMYGLASFEIRRRREEMTVRLALGATPHALRLRLAVGIVKPVTVGVLAGLPLSWVQVKLVGLSLPFVNADDLQTYLAAAAAILIAALVAAWLPGRRFLTMRVAELLRSS